MSTQIYPIRGLIEYGEHVVKIKNLKTGRTEHVRPEDIGHEVDLKVAKIMQAASKQTDKGYHVDQRR